MGATPTNSFTLAAAKATSSSLAIDLRWSINLLLRFNRIYSVLPIRIEDMANPVSPKVFSLRVLLVLICVSSRAQIPSPSPTPQVPALSLDEALRLANAQASTFQPDIFNDRL